MGCCFQNGKVKFTKIVATVSGNHASEELLTDLYHNGMDVVRMNSAHMTLAEMAELIEKVRKVSPELAVMLDTKGPNIRTCGVAPEGISLKAGEKVKISGVPGTDGRIQVNYAPFADEVPSGSRIVCDDGAAAFSVTGKADGCLIAEAAFDCVVQDRKSVNVPDVSLKAPALTEKDRMFLAEAVRLKCDFVAHSFVRNAEDIREVRRALGNEGREIGIIAKIENREGVRNIQEILKEADGLMVARGDLGIEIPLEEVPRIQKQLIYEARMAAKPVITATQMLQSMENAPSPTRAEVSDVANAVYDGTDAVMLSGETAHGNYPREAVAMMAKIVMEAEEAPEHFFTDLREIPDWDKKTAYVLAAAVRSAEYLPVKAIVCSSAKGLSARVCSALRPRIPLFVPTPSEISMRKLALSYGVFPSLAEFNENPWYQFQQALDCVQAEKTGLKGTDLIMFIGKNSSAIHRNNILCLATIDELQNGHTEKSNPAEEGHLSSEVCRGNPGIGTSSGKQSAL